MIHILRTNFMEFMLKRCKELSISYKMPDQKIIFPDSLSIYNFDAVPIPSPQLPTIPSSLPTKTETHTSKK